MHRVTQRRLNGKLIFEGELEELIIETDGPVPSLPIDWPVPQLGESYCPPPSQTAQRMHAVGEVASAVLGAVAEVVGIAIGFTALELLLLPVVLFGLLGRGADHATRFAGRKSRVVALLERMRRHALPPPHKTIDATVIDTRPCHANQLPAP